MTAPPLTISAAQPAELTAIREMFNEYASWLGSVFAGTGLKLVLAQIAREGRELPGEYQPPQGALLIARGDDRPVGMVALRRLDIDRCEMKRLYVRPEVRGAGLGRRLAERVIAEARRLGYREMVLDTLPAMHEAQRMYVALGFRDIAPYYESPLAGTRYMALTLTAP
jgi:putative acetyltransferase